MDKVATAAGACKQGTVMPSALLQFYWTLFTGNLTDSPGTSSSSRCHSSACVWRCMAWAADRSNACLRQHARDCATHTQLILQRHTIGMLTLGHLVGCVQGEHAGPAKCKAVTLQHLVSLDVGHKICCAAVSTFEVRFRGHVWLRAEAPVAPGPHASMPQDVCNVLPVEQP